MQEDNGHSTWLNSLGLGLGTYKLRSKVLLETVGKSPRANFLNMGEVLREHDIILGEQNLALHFLEKFSPAHIDNLNCSHSRRVSTEFFRI